jgi:predicted GIY-YIG superfamily endonuclease
MSTTNIYVLKLEGGRYYVGKTNNLIKRYEEHLSGRGSAWTKLHKPIKLEKSIENVSPFEEDKITKEYMSKYGIDKVRGGSYVETELSDFQKDALNTEIWAAKDCCTNCGRKGHFVKDCYAKSDASGNKIEYAQVSNSRAIQRYDESSDEEEWDCDYCDKSFRTEFGCRIHEKSCRSKGTTPTSGKKCFRCGRADHYSYQCYASSHTKGYDLDSDSDSD